MNNTKKEMILLDVLERLVGRTLHVKVERYKGCVDAVYLGVSIPEINPHHPFEIRVPYGDLERDE